MKANILIETKNLSKEEWLRVRKRGLGGSDISVLLGINPWRSELELWLDKTNQTNEPVVENEAMYFGKVITEKEYYTAFEKYSEASIVSFSYGASDAANVK